MEWERLEFKKDWNPESILHTMCAFANDIHNLGGGYIFIGVEEADGKPVLPPIGLNDSRLDYIQQKLLSLGYNYTIPQYHPVVAPCVRAQLKGQVRGQVTLVNLIMANQSISSQKKIFNLFYHLYHAGMKFLYYYVGGSLVLGTTSEFSDKLAIFILNREIRQSTVLGRLFYNLNNEIFIQAKHNLIIPNLNYC